LATAKNDNTTNEATLVRANIFILDYLVENLVLKIGSISAKVMLF
jgi:hypothetical protein